MILKVHHWSPTQNIKSSWVLLHGMGGTGAIWKPIALELTQQGHEVFALDQRGHGGSRVDTSLLHSAHIDQFTPRQYGADIQETLETALPSPAWVVGHSMGVRTACAYAHLAPQKVRGLVLVDLNFTGAAGGGLGQKLKSFLEVLPTRFPSRDAARTHLMSHAPDASMAKYLLAVSVVGASGEVSFPFDREALVLTIEAARGFTVRNWIREFASSTGKPVLALRGGESQVWSKEDFESEKAFFSDLPQVRFEEVTGAGHSLPFEKRIEFVRILDQLSSDH